MNTWLRSPPKSLSLSTIGKTRLVKTPSWGPQHTERTICGPRLFFNIDNNSTSNYQPSFSFKITTRCEPHIIERKCCIFIHFYCSKILWHISKLTKNWKKGNNSRRLVWQGIQPEKSKHHCPLSQSFDQDYNVLTWVGVSSTNLDAKGKYWS